MNLKSEQAERTLSVIIPAYNEQFRLPETVRDLFAYFSSQTSAFHLLEVLIIDDGSTDGTLDLIVDLKKEFPLIRLIHLSPNFGKGAAVHAGLSKALGDWFLIADADQSTPWKEVEQIFAEGIKQSADLIMGSRALAHSQVEIHQAWWREGMGKLFNWMIRRLFGFQFLDTQCGFKLLKNSKALAQVILSLQVKRFAWDVELILVMLGAGLKIIEVPVTWRNKLDSRVHPLRDSAEMLCQLVLLKFRLTRISKNNAQ
jgi:hypothetical protein